MNRFFNTVYILVIFQRILELVLARNNAQYMRRLGASEIDAGHYKYIVGLHITFFVGLFAEVKILRRPQPSWWGFSFSLFTLVQGLRIWCLMSLGKFWNTRIFVLPGAKPVVKGPYKFLRHPNYLVVICEILLFPLSFGAYYTAIIASCLNAYILKRRIRVEEEALKEFTTYGQDMQKVPRLIFSLKTR